MPSIADVLRTIRTEAEGAASAVESLHRGNRDLVSDARDLASITAAPSPASFVVPVPPSSPSTFTPITGSDGSTIGGIRSQLGLSPSRSGGSRVGGSGGSESAGRGRINPDMLTSLNGRYFMPREWIAANCTPFRMTIPGTPGLGGNALGEQEIDAWQCPLPWGVFLERRDFQTISKSSTGGSVTGSGTTSRIPRPGGGAYGPGGAFGGRAGGGTGISGPNDPGVHTAPGGGPDLQSGAQGLTVSSPDVVAEQRRTNDLLEKAIRGDGGTGLRAGGLI